MWYSCFCFCLIKSLELRYHAGEIWLPTVVLIAFSVGRAETGYQRLRPHPVTTTCILYIVHSDVIEIARLHPVSVPMIRSWNFIHLPPAISQSLTAEAVKAIAHAFTSVSRLHNYILSAVNQIILQSVMDTAAHLLAKLKTFDSITPTLHWLLMLQLIDYKVAVVRAPGAYRTRVPDQDVPTISQWPYASISSLSNPKLRQCRS